MIDGYSQTGLLNGQFSVNVSDTMGALSYVSNSSVSTSFSYECAGALGDAFNATALTNGASFSFIASAEIPLSASIVNQCRFTMTFQERQDGIRPIVKDGDITVIPTSLINTSGIVDMDLAHGQNW